MFFIKRRSVLAAAYAASLVVLSVPNFALAGPPCDEECEFLVSDFAGEYPDNAERAAGKWQCWDESAKISTACTFIRGKDIEKFSHVYRKKEAAASETTHERCMYLCRIEGRFTSDCERECP